MRKGAYIELIQRYLMGGDVPAEVRRKYHPLEVAAWVEEGLKAVVERYKAEGSAISVGHMLKPFEVESFSGSFPDIYFTLPAQSMFGPEYIYLKVECGECGENGKEINYRQFGGQEIMYGHLKGNTPYFTLHENVIHIKNQLVTKVNVILVPSFSSADDDDEFSLPGDMSDRLLTWLTNMLIRKRQLVVDKKNNQKIDDEPI
jgi:hypothetical protein